MPVGEKPSGVVGDLFIPTSFTQENCQQISSRKRTRSLSSIDYIKRNYFDIYRWRTAQLKSPTTSPLHKKKKVTEDNKDLNPNSSTSPRSNQPKWI